MKTETATAPTKQTYETPELSTFGKLENVTKGASGAADGDNLTSV